MLLLGIAAGFVWLLLAQPAEWEVRQEGIVLTEAASKGQFSVVVLFVIVGAVASLIGGIFAAFTLPDLSWALIPFVVVLAVIGSVLAWRLGVALGPDDPATATGVSVGDRIPAELSVDGLAPFLVWPIAALLGLIATIGLSRPEPESELFEGFEGFQQR